jgi:hypothetical protein
MLDTSAEILICRIRDIEERPKLNSAARSAGLTEARQFLAGMKLRPWIYR